jgi:hypothetical protein
MRHFNNISVDALMVIKEFFKNTDERGKDVNR